MKQKRIIEKEEKMKGGVKRTKGNRLKVKGGRKRETEER